MKRLMCLSLFLMLFSKAGFALEGPYIGFFSEKHTDEQGNFSGVLSLNYACNEPKDDKMSCQFSLTSVTKNKKDSQECTLISVPYQEDFKLLIEEGQPVWFSTHKLENDPCGTVIAKRFENSGKWSLVEETSVSNPDLDIGGMLCKEFIGKTKYEKSDTSFDLGCQTFKLKKLPQ